MEFKKISESKFECLLREEDLQDNNITLDDFFRNDTEKIHSLMEVVMEEAYKNIGIELDGAVMSLRLAPLPNHSILLTVSCGTDDFGDMLRDAGKKAAMMMSELNASKSESNVIKKSESAYDDRIKAAPFKDIQEKSKEDNGIIAIDTAGDSVGPDNALFCFEDIETVEAFCEISPKTWGIKNKLYKDEATGEFYLVLLRARSSKQRFSQFINLLSEYGEFAEFADDKISFMDEHYTLFIPDNAVNTIKRYCNA